MTDANGSGIYGYDFVVPESAVDHNGHVNNVVYVQWMQDVAIQHADAVGGTQATQAIGATWVARSHRIEYLSPAFPGEELTALSWVANVRRVRSLRRYRFVRKCDGKVLAEGETEWIFMDAATGRPKKIPVEVARVFPLLEDDPRLYI